ncbi:MAG: Xaa-Pro peptidase family protein [Bacteroidales bacterium]
MSKELYPKHLATEINNRVAKIAESLKANGIDAILITDNANLFYTASYIFSGYTFINADGSVKYYVKRPNNLVNDNIIFIRKPEQIAETADVQIANVAFELDTAPYSEIQRLQKIFPQAKIHNGSAIMRSCRAIKSEYEISQLKESGVHHAMAYKHIPALVKEGMSDIKLQIEIERTLRMEGSLGAFRISGNSMEIFMGSLIVGDNADNPSPYDFAMGGEGLNRSLPVGSNGTIIKRGTTIMVDMGGNFNGYMTDMTRVFNIGAVNELSQKAHNLSIAITKELSVIGKAGVAASELYNRAIEMVQAEGLADYFMGHKQKAGFIGHGVGIEINEIPVIAPKSRDVLEVGNTIALEPKFVIPGVGAVGIENTYVVTEDGLELLTNFSEEIHNVE